jgi:hypothetical protein
VFLILSRWAGSLHFKEAVGPWFFGVAQIIVDSCVASVDVTDARDARLAGVHHAGYRQSGSSITCPIRLTRNNCRCARRACPVATGDRLAYNYRPVIRTPASEVLLHATPNIRSLPQPTDDQYTAFADHVGEAHSWYKHLPILNGGQFVVFLAPDSGIGRLVARFEGTGYQLVTPPEGPVFTEANPRLHYSWRISEEYRRRFGYLDYAYRTSADGTFGRDVGGPMDLPAEIWERCTFTLLPFVADGDSGRDSVRWAHKEAVERLRSGLAHPQRETVLEWAQLADAQHEAWSGLTDAEREIVLALDREEAEKPQTTPAIDRYLAIGTELEAVYFDRLRPGELKKIRKSLAALRGWLEEG